MNRMLLLAALLLIIPGQVKAQASPGFTKINGAPVSVLTFTDSACPNLTSCYYQVTAVDAQSFESAPSACAAAQICVGGNMAVAQMPSSGTHTVAVNWAASATAGVTYNVYRHIGPLGASNVATVVN